MTSHHFEPSRRRALAAALSLTAFGHLTEAIAAEGTRFVIGFAPGGGTDGVTRAIADSMKGTHGTVIVDNRSGAGGQLAVREVKSAAPDGRTLLLTPASMMAIYPHSFSKLGYDPLTDFVPVAQVAKFDASLVVSATSPIRNLSDLQAWLRNNPTKATIGTPGAGSSPHLVTAELMRRMNINDPAFVHYRGDPPQIVDIIGGTLPIAMLASGSVRAYQDKLRVLATTGSSRKASSPDVPTLRELGYDLVIEEWLGVFAPKGTPPAVVNDLNKSITEALRSEKSRTTIETLGFQPAPQSPQEFAATLAADYRLWGRIVKSLGFKAD